MAMFDNAQFMAPTGLEPRQAPNLGDILTYRNKQKMQDFDLQKQMAEFQSNLRLQELGKQIALEKANQPPPQPMQHFVAGMTPYQAGQLRLGEEKLQSAKSLGEDKIAAGRDEAASKTAVSQQNADTRKRLASLHDMTDSQKLNLLQEGKVTLEEIRAANALDLADEKGDITSRQIDQKGGYQISLQGMRNAGAIANTQARGTEARKTKQTPSANASTTANLPSQQVKGQQLRMTQGIYDHPEWQQWMTIDQNTGQVNIHPPKNAWYSQGPDQKTYDAMVGHMKGTETPKFTGKQTYEPSTPTSGTVKVTADDGTTGTWDYSKGPLPQGYTIIKQDQQ